MTLYVVIMVCAASVANCTPATARAYQAFVAPPGNIVCGTPATMTIVQSAIAPGEHEYVRQRCELRQY